MVLISGAGNTTVVFWSTPISTRLWQVAQLQGQRVGHHDVRGGPERRVVWAIWLMAAATFSIATSALVASVTR
jgi:hypothetical protein